MSEDTARQLKEAVRALAAMRARLERAEAERNVPVAVAGLACRFPSAETADAFWESLAGGVDAVRPIPADRWDRDAWFDPDPEARGRIAYREAACLDDVDGFDADLFGIAAREAAGMDPQQRILLEVAWHALEDAGIAPDRLQRRSVGVFLGINGTDHLQMALADPDLLDAHALSGAVPSAAAGRLAFLLGLTGPALVVDTACSSSLAAVHIACQALLSGECDLALAGGAAVNVPHRTGYVHEEGGYSSPDGRCRPFDASANGYVRGEGCALIVLKRLTDATRDGDPILALIRASAINQDGRTSGIAAPNGRSQQAVIRAALEQARWSTDRISYIEAHGTSTRSRQLTVTEPAIGSLSWRTTNTRLPGPSAHTTASKNRGEYTGVPRSRMFRANTR